MGHRGWSNRVKRMPQLKGERPSLSLGILHSTIHPAGHTILIRMMYVDFKALHPILYPIAPYPKVNID